MYLNRAPPHRQCMETVLIAARYDKICHHSTFDGGCAIILDVEITDKLFLVVFFSVYRKLSNSTVLQWRTMPSSSLWSFGWCQFSFPGTFKLPGFPQDRCRRWLFTLTIPFTHLVFVVDTSIGVSHLNTHFLHWSYNLYSTASPETSNISWLSCQNCVCAREQSLMYPWFLLVCSLWTESKPLVTWQTI